MWIHTEVLFIDIEQEPALANVNAASRTLLSEREPLDAASQLRSQLQKGVRAELLTSCAMLHPGVISRVSSPG